MGNIQYLTQLLIIRYKDAYKQSIINIGSSYSKYIMLLVRQQPPFILPNLFKTLNLLSSSHSQYINLNFTTNSLLLTIQDNSQPITIGMQLPSGLFHTYFCQCTNTVQTDKNTKNKMIMVPLNKISKILNMVDQSDDSLMLIYQQQNNQIKIRSYSIKNQQQITTKFKAKIKKQFGDMISQKYEQPINPIFQLKTLKQDYSQNIVQFKISAQELLYIYKQFQQASLMQPKIISIKYLSQRYDNSKYLTFYSETQNKNNPKIFTINSEKLETDKQKQLLIFLQRQQLKNKQKQSIKQSITKSMMRQIDILQNQLQQIQIKDQKLQSNKITLQDSYMMKGLDKIIQIMRNNYQNKDNNNNLGKFYDNVKMIIVQDKHLIIEFKIGGVECDKKEQGIIVITIGSISNQ